MKSRHAGFTIIELMYTITIAGLLLGIGVPTFTNTIRNSEMTATSNSIVTALHVARSEAIKRRTRVTVCPAKVSGGNPVCVANGLDLLIFVNVNDDSTFDSATGDIMIQYQEWIRGKIKIRAGGLPGYVSYASTGFTRAIGGGPLSGNLTMCDDRGDSSARVMSLSATGRPQVRHLDDAPTAPTCS